jgi:transcriptional regulator with XRE-family HTH domain
MRNHWAKTWRECEGWTPAELAQRSGFPLGVVQALERGEPVAPAVPAKIRDVINTARRERAGLVILRLPQSQRSIERLLGLSQGYLSRLGRGAGNPSPALIALLTLLANDPNRFAELEPRAAPPLTNGDTPPADDTWSRITRNPRKKGPLMLRVGPQEHAKIAKALTSQRCQLHPGGPGHGQA